MTDEPNADDVISEESTEEDAPDFEVQQFDDEDFGAEGEIDAHALLAEATEDQLRTRASWHLLHKEIFVFLFANCLFFAGALAAWNRAIPGQPNIGAANPTGLDTIRGAAIFALAIYGFWQAAFNIWGRQMKVWPYVLNALLALWVGIGGFTSIIGSDRWDAAKRHLDSEAFGSKTALDDAMVPLSSIPPAYWCLTVGGIIVLIVIVRGILSGAQAAKASAAEGDEGRRRRR